MDWSLEKNNGVLSPKTKRDMFPDKYSPRTKRFKDLKGNAGAPDKRLKLEVNESKDKGKGVFNMNDSINKKLFPIVEYTGDLVKYNKTNKSRYITPLTTTKSRYAIDSVKNGNISRFINGNDGPWDKPNCKMWESTEEPRVYIYSTRSIKKGEELKMDYGKGYYKKVYNLNNNRIEYTY